MKMVGLAIGNGPFPEIRLMFEESSGTRYQKWKVKGHEISDGGDGSVGEDPGGAVMI